VTKGKLKKLVEKVVDKIHELLAPGPSPVPVPVRR
jgi:hypothetical protein